MIEILSMNKLFTFFDSRPVWLVSERVEDARDNGFWMFKYLKENHPEINSKYVIRRNSADRKRLEAWSKDVLTKPSLKLLYFQIKAECYLSAHFWHCRAFLAFSPLISKRIESYFSRKPIIRLQHGITKDDLSDWLGKANYKTDMFVCGAAPEYEYLKQLNIYPPEVFRYTGFARYDGLVNEAYGNRQILIMPTWRHWIKTEAAFLQSDYYRAYVSLLTDKHFLQFLQQNNLHAVLYLHHCFQKYTSAFTRLNLPSCITIASKEETDEQALLRQSNLLVTDYSSVAFDFAYLQKPIIYYQFDEEDYRKGHFPQGYFDYHEGLGPWTAQKEALLHEIEKCVAADFEMEPQYRKRVNAFFTYHDQNNCERIYQEVIRTIRK